MIAHLFGVTLAPWEEQLLAAALLEGADEIAELCENPSDDFQEVWTLLRTFPESWQREIACQVFARPLVAGAGAEA